MAGIETEVDGQQTRETLQQQSRTNQQHERHGCFRDDEHFLRVVPPLGHASATFFQRSQ